MENNSFSGKQGNKVLENQFPLFFEPDSKICGKKILHEGKKKSFFFLYPVVQISLWDTSKIAFLLFGGMAWLPKCHLRSSLCLVAKSF